MNILVYSNVPLWTIHHAEAVELCLRHVAVGDRVYLLSCDGSLTSCPANPSHDPHLCRRCKRQTNWTLGKVLENQVIDLRLPPPEKSASIPTFTTLFELCDYTENNVPYGELVASQIVADYKDCFLPLDALKTRIEDLLVSARSLYGYSREIIRAYRIDKVYVWNGRRCSDGPVAFAARDSNIQYETYISAAKRSHITLLPALRVHEIAPNKNLMNAFVQSAIAELGTARIKEEADIFYKQLRDGSGDYPGFIYYAKGLTQSPTPQARKPMLTIFTSSLWECFGMSDYTSPIYPNHYQGIYNILSDQAISSNWDCRVRWHPQLATCGQYEREEILRIISLTGDKATHYPPDSNISSYALLDESAAVLTFGSTIGIEANYYGKPSILVGRAIYEDLDSCYRPSSHSQLVELLGREMTPLPRDGSLVFGFYMREGPGIPYQHLHQLGDSDFERNGLSLAAVSPMRKLLNSFPFSRQVISSLASAWRTLT